MPPKVKPPKVLNRKVKAVTSFDDVPLRLKIFLLMDRVGVADVELPWWGFYVRSAIYRFLLFVTVVSSLNIIVESLPEYAELKRPNTFSDIETFCVSIYTGEWIIRLFSAPDTKAFLLNPLNMIDLLGLVPWYLELGGVVSSGVSKWIIMLRISRLVRALLFFRNFDIVVTAVEQSTEVVALLFIIVAIGMPLGGTVMHYAERGTWNQTAGYWQRPCTLSETCLVERSPFQTAEDGMWFFITTSTTLGFGDMYPKSNLGKTLAAAIMSLGVFNLSFPIMILAANFEEERVNALRKTARLRARDGRRLKELQKEHTVDVAAGAADGGAAAEDAADEGFEEDEHDDLLNPLSGGSKARLKAKIPTVYFASPEDNVPREIRQYTKDECRYAPLLIPQRNQDGTLYVETGGKNRFEMKMFLVLDSRATQQEALTAANVFVREGAPKFKRARHYEVVALFAHLETPREQCAFLRSLKMPRTNTTGIDPIAHSVPLTMELINYPAEIEDQRRFDLLHALHQCRLHICAALAMDEPKVYDVPIFLDHVRSTNLMTALLNHKHRLVYATEKQVLTLLNGLTHLLAIPDDKGDHMVTNGPEIIKAATKALLSQCATICDDPNELYEDSFLFGETNDKHTYYGIFVGRLQGKADDEEEADELGIGGGAEDEDMKGVGDSKERKVLCHVSVRVAKPTYLNFSILL